MPEDFSLRKKKIGRDIESTSCMAYGIHEQSRRETAKLDFHYGIFFNLFLVLHISKVHRISKAPMDR